MIVKDLWIKEALGEVISRDRFCSNGSGRTIDVARDIIHNHSQAISWHLDKRFYSTIKQAWNQLSGSRPITYNLALHSMDRGSHRIRYKVCKIDENR
ncbi:hypothetical protein CU102_23040 [Phyllobacterium brassicacearum]|uniref:Uncharacterized protein n=1 Tax=Phyllobacterium brassicacearum TaxID=314235 RepID=A0A2P7BB80_9HYPH|nr:hypothetical protein CU102_23040 [Phyllobacterium brassicacearum]